LQAMKGRCREWYEQLMQRVNMMENAYQQRMEEEIERRVHLQHEMETANKQSKISHSAAEIDELSRENARLNEELEKFKGKYFDSEQKKIELNDAVDDIREEKFKMEAKLEEMAAMRANNMLSLNNEEEEEDDDDDDERREKPESEWRDLVQKLREEKESQEAQYEEEFREFERMANEKVVQLEEYYVQQLQMKETYVQSLQQQLQTTLLSKTTNKEQQEVSVPVPVAGINDEELQKLKTELAAKSELCSKLNVELSNLKYAASHEREQAKMFKKRNDSNESKISAYNASFIELAEKLKQLNDGTKSLRKDKDKQKKKVAKLEKTKKKLKGQIKILNEKIENITAVTKELVKIKHQSKQQSEMWTAERAKYEQNIDAIKREQMEQSKAKIATINKYNVEMNNLRTNIKTLQKRIVSQSEEIDKMREMDSQSVLGSAANWGKGWWSTTKK